MRHAIATFLMLPSLAAVSFLALAGEAPAIQLVEILLGAEHSPEGLKSGDKVDLKIVTGKAGIGKRTIYMTQTIAVGLEVRRLVMLEKPDEHGRSIRVELTATAAQAKTVEKAKAQVATLVETVPGEGTTTARRPVPFRIERAKP